MTVLELIIATSIMSQASQKKRLADLVRSLREERGLSQRKFAAVLGVSYGSIRDYENCKISAKGKNLSILAQEAGWTLDQLWEYLKGGEPSSPRSSESVLQQIESLLADLPIEEQEKVLEKLKISRKS